MTNPNKVSSPTVLPTRDNAPCALVLDEQEASAQMVADHLESHAFDVESLASLDKLNDMAVADAVDIDLVVVSTTFPGLESDAVAARLLALFPIAPFVVIGEESDVSWASSGPRRVHLDFVGRPIDQAALDAPILEATCIAREFRRALQRYLFQKQSVCLEEAIARILHDVNNQITGLKGGIDLLSYAMESSRSLDVKQKVDRYMEEFIRPGFAQIEGMSDNWRRLRENRVRVLGAADLVAVIEHAVTLTSMPGQRGCLSLKVMGDSCSLGSCDRGQRAAPEVRISAVPDQLAMALAHILQNAFEATEEVGEARIQIEIDSAEDKEMVRLSIYDNGAGIPKAAETKIWNAFHTTKGGPKNGMGLSIAKQIIDKHHGQIACVASPLGGAGIEILLPRAKS